MTPSLMEVGSMTDPTPLSPAAQAVWNAANNSSAYGPEDCLNEARQIAAAALRAAADQGQLGPEHWEGTQANDYEKGWNAALNYVSTIAAELDGGAQ